MLSNLQKIAVPVEACYCFVTDLNKPPLTLEKGTTWRREEEEFFNHYKNDLERNALETDKATPKLFT